MPRISATVTTELKADMLLLAIEDKRSFSEMISLLLQQAVKERLRRRKGASKEDHKV
jgi:hypothetical protein